MSGIVRKVDELGRIVIPKELRKTLNIKNSDDLEITIDNNKIVLEKFYRLKNLKEALNFYYSIFEKFLSSRYIITDKENVLLASKNINFIDNQKISYQLIEAIDSRRQFLDNKLLKITDNYEVNINYYFCPLIVNTDVLGSIIIFDENRISDRDLLILDIFKFLLKEKIE